MTDNLKPAVVECLAHVCICAKCVDVDAEFRDEVDALVAVLSPAERRACGEMVDADRYTPDELKACIEPIRLMLRYDYLLKALA